MKTGILIQARLSSSRFPKKMLSTVADDMLLIDYVYNQCMMSKIADYVAVITSDEESDTKLAEHCIRKGIPLFRGNLNNVLNRYIQGAEFFGTEFIVRICGDSPFADIDLMDQMIKYSLNRQLEYCLIDNCLNGFMSEFITLQALKKVEKEKNLTQPDQEHVTKYIRERSNIFKCGSINANLRPLKLQNYTLTIDYPEDLEVAKKITAHFKNSRFNSEDILKFLNQLEGQ